jgi:hypothetical protein
LKRIVSSIGLLSWGCTASGVYEHYQCAFFNAELSWTGDHGWLAVEAVGVLSDASTHALSSREDGVKHLVLRRRIALYIMEFL